MAVGLEMTKGGYIRKVFPECKTSVFSTPRIESHRYSCPAACDLLWTGDLVVWLLPFPSGSFYCSLAAPSMHRYESLLGQFHCLYALREDCLGLRLMMRQDEMLEKDGGCLRSFGKKDV